jgi:hypothetical protein
MAVSVRMSEGELERKNEGYEGDRTADTIFIDECMSCWFATILI